MALSESIWIEIRRRRENGESFPQIAKDYGVNHSSIVRGLQKGKGIVEVVEKKQKIKHKSTVIIQKKHNDQTQQTQQAQHGQEDNVVELFKKEKKKLPVEPGRKEWKFKGLEGRPSDYSKDMLPRVKKLCLLGLNDIQLAAACGINQDTFYEWRKIYPEFSETIDDGRINADGEVVRSLYDRARGYTVDAVKIFNANGTPMIVDYQEYYPPDVNAIRMWLFNRKPEYWKDRVELKVDADIKLIPWDALEKITDESTRHADLEYDKAVTGRAERLGLTFDYSRQDDSIDIE